MTFFLNDSRILSKHQSKSDASRSVDIICSNKNSQYISFLKERQQK